MGNRKVKIALKKGTLRVGAFFEWENHLYVTGGNRSGLKIQRHASL